MLDLDSLESKGWTSEDELYCQFGAALCMNQLSYVQFLELRGDLLADRYVNPEYRTIHKPLVNYLVQYQANSTNVSWLFCLYLNVSHIHVHYTEQEQICILNILRKNAAVLA